MDYQPRSVVCPLEKGESEGFSDLLWMICAVKWVSGTSQELASLTQLLTGEDANVMTVSKELPVPREKLKVVFNDIQSPGLLTQIPGSSSDLPPHLPNT